MLTVVEPGSYDAQSNYNVPVTQWLSNSVAPVPARDLGLVVQLPEFPAVIGGLNDDGRATASGVDVGDEFLSVDGVSVMDWPHLVDVIQASPEQTLNVIVLRSGQTMKTEGY